MYIHVNDFNYTELLDKLVEHLNLQDEPITNEFIKVVFNRLANKFKKHSRDKMTPEEIELVEGFLVHTDNWDDYQIGITPEDFWEAKGESLGLAIDGLSEQLSDPDPEVTDTMERFYDALSGFPDFDIGTEEGVGELIGLLMSLLTKYQPVEFDEMDLYILYQMANNDSPLTLIKDIDIIDFPAKVIKYRDTLITFPLILIKAI